MGENELRGDCGWLHRQVIPSSFVLCIKTQERFGGRVGGSFPEDKIAFTKAWR